MPISVGHNKNITIADGTDTGVVRPSDWNSNHAVTLNLSGTDMIGGFSNGGNVSFGTSANSAITANAPTTFLASNEPHIQSVVAGASTFTNGQVVLSGSGGVTVTYAGQTAIISFDGHHMDAVLPGGNNNGTGFSSMTSGTFGLNVTGELSMSQNGNNVTISGPAQTVQPAVGQLNGSSGTLSFAVGSSLSASSNASTITLGLASNITTALQSAGNYLTTAAQSNQVVNSLQGSTGPISFAVGSSLSASSNASTVTFGLASNITTALQSAGAYLTTAAQSTQTNAFSIGGNSSSTNSSVMSAGGYQIFGGNGVTLLQNNNSLTIQGAAPGGTTNFTLSAWDDPLNWWNLATVASGQTNASVSFIRFLIDDYIQFTNVAVPASFSMATAANASIAYMVMSNFAVIYTKNAGTFNPIVGAANTQTLQWASNTGSYSSVTGPRLFSIPLQSTLQPGEYYLGLQISTSSGYTNTGGGTTALNATMSMVLGTMGPSTATAYAYQNALTNATSNFIFEGLNSVVLTGTNQTMQTSQFTVTGAAIARAQVPVMFRG